MWLVQRLVGELPEVGVHRWKPGQQRRSLLDHTGVVREHRQPQERKEAEHDRVRHERQPADYLKDDLGDAMP